MFQMPETRELVEWAKGVCLHSPQNQILQTSNQSVPEQKDDRTTESGRPTVWDCIHNQERICGYPVRTLQLECLETMYQIVETVFSRGFEYSYCQIARGAQGLMGRR
jgi:hypothetical protein